MGLLFYFGYPISSGKGTDQENELSIKMMKLLGQFGDTGKPDLSIIGEDIDWIQFNPDADALIIDKDAGFHMEPLWRTEALVFWKTHCSSSTQNQIPNCISIRKKNTLQIFY